MSYYGFNKEQGKTKTEYYTDYECIKKIIREKNTTLDELNTISNAISTR